MMMLSSLRNKLYLLLCVPYSEGSPRSYCELQTGFTELVSLAPPQQAAIASELCEGDTFQNVSTLADFTTQFIVGSNVYILFNIM